MHRGLGLKLNLTSTAIIALGEQEAVVMIIPPSIRYVVVCIQTGIRSFGIHSSTLM